MPVCWCFRRPEMGIEGIEIEEVLGVAQRFVPEELLDESGWKRLLDRVSGEMPGSAVMSNLAGFEFRLGEAEPSADFGLTLTAPSPLVDFFVEQGRTAPAGSGSAAMGAYLSQMSSDAWPASAILEYDVVGVTSDERPSPGLFMNVGPYPENAGCPPPGEVVGILADALCLPRDDGEREAVERVCEALPPGGFVHSMGAMPSREQRAVRMSAKGIEAGDVADYLHRIDWAGPVGRLEDTFSSMVTAAPSFFVAVDVTPHGPLPHVGLGMAPHGEGEGDYIQWLYAARHDWELLVKHLVGAGWCLPSKGEALLALPGVHRLLCEFGALVVFQTIAWVKVAVSDQGVQAKAYSALVVSGAQ